MNQPGRQPDTTPRLAMHVEVPTTQNPETRDEFLETAFLSIGRLQTTTREEGLEERLKDVTGEKVPSKYYIETQDVHRATQLAARLGLQIVLIGSLTSGTKNFGAPGVFHDPENIIAIKPKQIPAQLLEHETDIPPYLLSNQAVINYNEEEKPKTITVGPALTPDEINELLPAGYYIPLDLTTRGQAQIGAVLTTGAMGPSRIRPHEVIKKVKISDGETIRIITGEEIENIEGLLGLTGAIIELELEILEVPKEKFITLLPLNVNEEDPNETSNWTHELSHLLTKLYPALATKIEDGKITSEWKDGYLDGVEIITKAELEMVIENVSSPEIKGAAQQALKCLKDAKSTFLAYITGRANGSLFDLNENTTHNPLSTMMELLEAEKVGEPIMPEGSTALNNLALLREAIPDYSKKEALPQTPDQVVFSTSTDINTTLSESFLQELEHLAPMDASTQLQEAFHTMLKPYINYEKQLAQIAKEHDANITVRRYGHAHPREIDPHTRATLIDTIDNQEAFETVKALIQDAKTQLITTLLSFRENPNYEVNHGEKGKPPTFALLTEQQREKIQSLLDQAPTTFSWRAKGTSFDNTSPTPI